MGQDQWFCSSVSLEMGGRDMGLDSFTYVVVSWLLCEVPGPHVCHHTCGSGKLKEGKGRRWGTRPLETSLSQYSIDQSNGTRPAQIPEMGSLILLWEKLRCHVTKGLCQGSMNSGGHFPKQFTILKNTSVF